MHISGLKQSKFLTRADANPPILVTIEEVYQDNVAKEGAPEELKWCIKFTEHEKPMVLNSTNGQIIAQIVKSEETDTWPGHKIVLYDDPNVSFGGKLVGGIRARAPRGQAAKAVKPASAAVMKQPEPKLAEPGPEQESDDVPF